MAKATKATKKRLANEDFTPRVRVSTLLECIVRLAEAESAEAFYANDCLCYSCYQHEANLFRGLESKYPKLIHTTLTHGLNEIKIPDINKLVKAMLADR